MREFNVPQFIDVEDRIIGPITVRQFITLLVGGGLLVVAYRLVTFNVFLLLAFFITVLAVVFAFVKINGQGFHLFLINFLVTLRRPRIRVWSKEYTPSVAAPAKREEPRPLPRPPLPPGSKISELSLMVDTEERILEKVERMLRRCKNFHNMAVKRPSTQQYLDIAEIRNDTVVLQDGSLRSVLLVSSLNFSLKVRPNKKRLWGLCEFLNTLDFPCRL